MHVVVSFLSVPQAHYADRSPFVGMSASTHRDMPSTQSAYVSVMAKLHLYTMPDVKDSKAPYQILRRGAQGMALEIAMFFRDKI